MIRRLVLIIHQRNGANTECACGRDLGVRVVAHCEIKSAAAGPLCQRRGPADEIAGFACKLAAAMATNHYRGQAGGLGQLNCLRVIASSNLDLMTTFSKQRDERAKERHVWRVCEIDPNSHRQDLGRQLPPGPKHRPSIATSVRAHRSSISQPFYCTLLRSSSRARPYASHASDQRMYGMRTVQKRRR